MDFLKNLFHKNPFHFIALPAGLSVITLIGNILCQTNAKFCFNNATGLDLHQIISSANSVESVILMLVLFFIRTIKGGDDAS